MTTPEFDDLENQLAGLTQWQGREPQVWRKALRAANKPGRARRILAFIRTRPIITAAAACLTLAAVGTTTWQVSQQSFRTVCQANLRGTDVGFATYSELPRPFNQVRTPHYLGYELSAGAQSSVAKPQAEGEGRNDWRYSVQSGVVNSSPARASSDRKVVRRVTLQLSTPDVRAAYLRAAHLISEARGEFVQDSGLTGSGNQTQANLTLRVAADRLPEVLDQLRELGKVESEQANGEDVTEQAVDLEARLDNERRVETELQKLLETRQNSPLEDVLKLRDKLSEVRGSIERLTAERDKLGRLVSLATVLVIIRPADATADAPPAPPTIKDYFVNAVAAAWVRSLRFLADTVALFVGILIGGLIWWLLLAAIVVVAVRYRRQKQDDSSS